MRRLFMLLLLPNMLIAKEQKYLKSFFAYRQASYFATQVYQEHTVATFYKLKEINMPVNIDSLDIHLLNACLFFATNKLRLLHHKQALKIDFNLKNAAAIHSFQMSTYHFFAHNHPYNSKLKTSAQRLKLCGITTAEAIGENCHKTSIYADLTYLELAQQVIESFYQSPAHKQNLLNAQFRYLACAAAIEFPNTDNADIIVTQDFYD